MKILIQWTTQDGQPQDWESLDSADWPALPQAPIHALNVQGVILAGDHFHVENLGPDGCRVTVRNDDPEDWAADEMWAEAWHFRPLAPDARLGGRLNTRQSVIVYAPPGHGEWSRGPRQGVEMRPWSELVPPSQGVRHGAWVSDEHHQAHLAARARVSWHAWEHEPNG